MMGWYHDGMGWGGWLLMTLAMVAFWALVVFAIVALFRGAAPGAARPTPEQILDERLARGEIDAAEHQACLGVLRGERHLWPSGTGGGGQA